MSRDIQLAFRSICIGGASNRFVELQVCASYCNCPRISVISGRVGGDGSRTSSHVWTNITHNGSENPTVGREGRFPVRTLYLTASSRPTCSKGRRPVATYRGKMRLPDRRRSGELMPTSRMVIPRAYISVLFDGNILRDRLVYPNLSGSRISGAIHRVVPPVA